MTIEETQAEIVEEFAFMEDWQEKYAYIIDLGREMPPIDDTHKSEANRVKGCQSQVWLHAEAQGDILHLEAESDALIVNGLIALLMRVYADRSPSDILEANEEFLKQIDLHKHLSPTRTNGLASMLTTIKRRAAEASVA